MGSRDEWRQSSLYYFGTKKEADDYIRTHHNYERKALEPEYWNRYRVRTKKGRTAIHDPIVGLKTVDQVYWVDKRSLTDDELERELSKDPKKRLKNPSTARYYKRLGEHESRCLDSKADRLAVAKDLAAWSKGNPKKRGGPVRLSAALKASLLESYKDALLRGDKDDAVKWGQLAYHSGVGRQELMRFRERVLGEAYRERFRKKNSAVWVGRDPTTGVRLSSNPMSDDELTGTFLELIAYYRRTFGDSKKNAARMILRDIEVYPRLKRLIPKGLLPGIRRTAGATKKRNSAVWVGRDPTTGVRLTGNPGSVDEAAAEDLELYIDNERSLYDRQLLPIIKNLVAKKGRGIYDAQKAVKLFMYLVDNGAKMYVKEFGGGAWNVLFSRPTRLAVATSMAERYGAEIMAGEYDQYLPKKYQKKGNPRLHYPKTHRGRPSSGHWWKMSMYGRDGRYKGAHVGRGTRDDAVAKARALSKKSGVSKVILDGPKTRRPSV